MIVIAGRPGMGKTSLAMNIAEHVAIDQKIPTGIFSLEMSKESIGLRLISSRSRIDFSNLQQGILTEQSLTKVAMTSAVISQSPLYIVDSSDLSILELRAIARRIVKQHGIRLLVIDYLQLIKSYARLDNRQEVVAEISRGIKVLAKELNIPIIIMSQLNRDIERDPTRKPRLSDLRESGAIEQDADFVGILYRFYDEQQSEENIIDSKCTDKANQVRILLMIFRIILNIKIILTKTNS